MTGESMVPVDIVDTVEATIRIAAIQMSGRAKLVRDFHPVPPVLSNRSKLGHVVLNLLMNAVQAIPEIATGPGEIVVRVAPIGSEEVEIAVTDSGTGIEPSVVARIFEPFFTTKPVGIDTGLGLSISQGIVVSLGGRISVESQAGVGSTFRVILPGAHGKRAVLAPVDGAGADDR